MADRSPAGSGKGLAFVYSHRVIYSDCTAGNHVYYGRYLGLLEAARGAFFRELGRSFLELQEQDVLFPVVECHLKYKRPARYDEVLRIEVWVTLATGVRLNFGYCIRSELGAVVLEGETWHVCASLSGRPKRLPEALPVLLQPYLRPA